MSKVTNLQSFSTVLIRNVIPASTLDKQYGVGHELGANKVIAGQEENHNGNYQN
ncbi:hypothetical protein [Paenibacillus sp. FSL K6-2524]|uniref:hypothetical protein n=1 Tax=Paenibacillus sp. FSL K6-2524 TaxID=2954516 RepID=UPI0030FD2057